MDDIIRGVKNLITGGGGEEDNRDVISSDQDPYGDPGVTRESGSLGGEVRSSDDDPYGDPGENIASSDQDPYGDPGAQR
ncbi:MAG TPA: translation initiation factor [Armatimonadota bacterium]|jgi:hypothetical protein